MSASVGFGKRVDEIGGGLALASSSMRMSSGPSRAEGKAALAFVKLERRHAEIERDAVGLRDALRVQQRVHLGEAAMDQRQPALEAFAQARGRARSPRASRSMP